MKIFLTGSVIPLMMAMTALFFLATAAECINEQPPVYFDLAKLERKPFMDDIEWWAFPLTRDRVFMELDLTKKQKAKINQLKKQYKQRLFDFKTQHHERLLNVLDADQRRKLEEKRGEIDRYMEKQIPHRRYQEHYRLHDPIRYTIPVNLQIGSSLKTINTQDPLSWGNVKREFIQ